MSTPHRPADVQRILYWQGQLLRGSDLRAQRTTEAELRWWHNRAIHGAYGVVEGLRVTQIAGGYRVAAGFAYDGYGRELLLPCAVDVPPPYATSGTSTLLISYDAGRSPSSCAPLDLQGTCLPAGRCPGNEHVVFHWRTGIVEGDCAAVPLARTTSSGFADVRPAVRPLARPYVRSGRTVPGSTDWDEWRVHGQLVGFETVVDTSAAGFLDVPCYFASLDGPRVWRSQAIGKSAQIKTHWYLPFDYVTDTAPRELTLRVLVLPDFASPNIVSLRNFLEFVRCHDVNVCWIGIERRTPVPFGGCEECCDERS